MEQGPEAVLAFQGTVEKHLPDLTNSFWLELSLNIASWFSGGTNNQKKPLESGFSLESELGLPNTISYR